MAYKLSDWNHVLTLSSCKVFMGSGWEKGHVVAKHGDSITVKLSRRTVRVFDPRSVKRA